MTTTDLDDEEIASIMGWSPDEVKRIRAIYVDDTARTMALGTSDRTRNVRRLVNRDFWGDPGGAKSLISRV